MEQKKKLTGYPSIDKPWLKYYTDEAINAPLPECTIYEYLWENNKDHLDDVALIYFGKKITYGELFENIDKTARAFSAIGVKSGDIVSICAISTPETIYSIYGANRIGAVCNIIEPRTNASNIVDRIKNSNSKVLLIQDVFYSKIKDINIGTEYTVILPISNSMPFTVKCGFFLAKGRKTPTPDYSDNTIAYKEFTEKQSDFFDKNTVYQKGQPAAIIYTGGTTGVSKGAVLSNDSINIVAFYFRDHNLCPRQTKYLDIMPPFIAYGFACGIHMPLCFGWKIIIIAAFEPKKFPDYIIKHKPNFFLGVPSHYEYLLKDKQLEKMDLSFVKVAAMGGDALNPELEKRIQDFFVRHNSSSVVYKGYGMTELSSAAVSTLACPGGSKFASLGVPFKHNIVSIFEPGTEKELRYGEQGEICITGPTMMLEYYQNPEETAKLFVRHSDGTMWIHSKDIGYMDEDGHLYFIDRIKRMIVRPDGHNVFPAQIEAVLLQHPSVEQCCVVGLKNPNGDNGRIPTAFVVLKEKDFDNMAEKDLDAFSKERLPERDVAMQYRFIEKLPLTPVGKVDYRALEKEAENT